MLRKYLVKKMNSRLLMNLKRLAIKFFYTDMMSERSITKENRVEIIMDKIKDFQKSELVITDRLQGMVFYAILGTYYIVF